MAVAQVAAVSRVDGECGGCSPVHPVRALSVVLDAPIPTPRDTIERACMIAFGIAVISSVCMSLCTAPASELPKLA